MTLSAIGRSAALAFQSFGSRIRSLFTQGPGDRTPDPSPNFLERFAAFDFVGTIGWAIRESFTRFVDWLTGSPPEPQAAPEATVTLTEEDLLEGARIYKEALEELHKERAAAARIEHRPPPPAKPAIESPPDPEPVDEPIPRKLTDEDHRSEHDELLNRVEKVIERRRRNPHSILRWGDNPVGTPRSLRNVNVKDGHEERLYQLDPAEKEVKLQTLSAIKKERLKEKEEKEKEIKKAKARKTKRARAKAHHAPRDGSHHRVARPALHRPQKEKEEEELKKAKARQTREKGKGSGAHHAPRDGSHHRVARPALHRPERQRRDDA